MSECFTLGNFWCPFEVDFGCFCSLGYQVSLGSPDDPFWNPPWPQWKGSRVRFHIFSDVGRYVFCAVGKVLLQAVFWGVALLKDCSWSGFGVVEAISSTEDHWTSKELSTLLHVALRSLINLTLFCVLIWSSSCRGREAARKPQSRSADWYYSAGPLDVACGVTMPVVLSVLLDRLTGCCLRRRGVRTQSLGDSCSWHVCQIAHLNLMNSPTVIISQLRVFRIV